MAKIVIKIDQGEIKTIHCDNEDLEIVVYDHDIMDEQISKVTENLSTLVAEEQELAIRDTMSIAYQSEIKDLISINFDYKDID
jgi:hypothetical protein